MESTGPVGGKTHCRGRFALLALALVAGCTNPSSPGEAPSSAARAAVSKDPQSGLTAEQIGERMLAAYRRAKSYSDHAIYVQHSVRRSEGVERELPFFSMTLAFERPNRLRLSFEEAVEDSAANQGFTITTNGAIVRSMAGGLKGQIHEAAAPATLTLANFLPDPYLREVFQGRSVGDVFPQLAMLVAGDDRQTVFPSDEAPRLLEPQELRGRPCYRMASSSAAGTRILWIDSETYLLHRMELPIDGQRRTLDPDGAYTQLAVWIDFEDAKFDAAIEPSAFEMEVPADARRVGRFVLPPPAAPPEELGRPIGSFELVSLDGQKVTPASLEGKVVLLSFWQRDCAPCKAHTPELDALYRELADRAGFAFYAVNTEPPSRVANDAAAAALTSWGGSMPLLRLASPETLSALKVAGTPTLLLVDAAGRLQYRLERQVASAAELKQIIERVLGGEDIAGRARAERRRLAADFARELDAVTIREAVIDVPLTETKAAARQTPATFAAEELWRTTDRAVAQPGYLLVVGGADDGSAAGAARALVVDGPQHIVELDSQGRQKSRRSIVPDTGAAGEIDAQSSRATRFLRTTADAQGRRYVVSGARGAQKLYLLDDELNHLLSFPKERNPGIADVLAAPVGADGLPRLYVGYWGGVGMQGIDLEGERKWSQRSLDHVVQVAAVLPAAGKLAVPDPATAADATAAGTYELWCTSSRGTIQVLDARGKSLREVRVGLRSIMYVAAARFDGQLQACGVDLKSIGQYSVVGFSPDGDVSWQFDLPPGEYASQVDRIQPVTLPGGQQTWMIASPDGTIHWLDRDGQEIDRFAYGQPLSGLALTNASGAAILWVAAADHVAAYKLTSKQ